MHKTTRRVRPSHVEVCAPGGKVRGAPSYGLRGFTLIEMMIVVAVIALLAAVALPSYRDSVKRSVRAEAQAYLMAVASRQQQFLMDTRAFSTASVDTLVTPPKNVLAAYVVSQSALVGPPPTLMLTATPTTDQATDKCGTLTLDQTGAKTAALVVGCW